MLRKAEYVKGDNLIFCSKRKRERDGDLEEQDGEFGKQGWLLRKTECVKGDNLIFCSEREREREFGKQGMNVEGIRLCKGR